eukprot:scaffold1430_cov257-Pinguiococcus_pyrenoidosus.AAC.2
MAGLEGTWPSLGDACLKSTNRRGERILNFKVQDVNEQGQPSRVWQRGVAEATPREEWLNYKCMSSHLALRCAPCAAQRHGQKSSKRSGPNAPLKLPRFVLCAPDVRALRQ